MLHERHILRWIQIEPPQLEQCHFIFSFSMKGSNPFTLINSKLFIILILYFVLYLLSSCLSLLQGRLGHSKQNPDSVFFQITQLRIEQPIIPLYFVLIIFLQPGQQSFFLWKAKHNEQFIPHGAIRLRVLSTTRLILF